MFISYSHEDAPWVEAVLLPGLEHPEDDGYARYRCLLMVHSRDWVPGEAIPDQILVSVERSLRTVIVLKTWLTQNEFVVPKFTIKKGHSWQL